MSRINLKIFTLSWWQWLLILVFVWLLFVVWPVKGFLLPQNWWGQSLIVVMNDNEARPCGGFATAYGELSLPLFKFNIGSTYELDADLGAALPPLDQVSDRLKFWDLGNNPSLHHCAQAFLRGYKDNTGKDVNRVILVHMSFLERWSALLGNEAFFANISRQVANVDHHDEASLETRKDPAGEDMKQIIQKTVFNPFNWQKATKLIGKAEEQHQFFAYRKSAWTPLFTKPTVSVYEWNLGGGKSSRYLRKHWSVDVQETVPGIMEMKINIHATHLGGYDAPLSQIWRGGFELNFRYGQDVFVPATIAPGESWTHTETLSLPTGACAKHTYLRGCPNLFLYTPFYQDWQTDFSLSVLAQQTISSKVLKTLESTALWSGKLPATGLDVDWKIKPDLNAPFLTLHKPIDANLLKEDLREILNWNEGDLVTELHFNEPIALSEAAQATLKDRDYFAKDITEDGIFKNLTLLADQTTLLINWSQETYQKDERFYLSLEGITDVWGNEYQNKPRTIITR